MIDLTVRTDYASGTIATYHQAIHTLIVQVLRQTSGMLSMSKNAIGSDITDHVRRLYSISWLRSRYCG